MQAGANEAKIEFLVKPPLMALKKITRSPCHRSSAE
jgi:hypothetical protein